ncbi:MAG TPA: choice-of-anchor D domain-containing protein, partial [Candidatus Kapabacteria bacterium]|nr:choice-of-anchor D domain-containing protein [Candidatus Kapabacteria bacterium]
NGAKNDTVQIRNCIWAGLAAGKDFTTNVAGFDAGAWFRSAAFANNDYTQPSDVKLKDAFNLTNPNFRPDVGSPALSGASFSNPKLSDPFFDQVGYRGAFSQNDDWDATWTNYDPQNTVYAPKPTAGVSSVAFGTINKGDTKDTTVAVVLTNTGNVVLSISDWSLSDASVFSVVGGTSPFVLRAGESKSVMLRFHPTAAGDFSSSLQFHFVTQEQSVNISITGSAKETGAVGNIAAERSVELYTNVPNPFAASTSVSYYLPKPSFVTLEVLDVTGKRIAVLTNGTEQVGMHTELFNADNLSNGLYILRLNANGITLTKQMLLAK